MQKAQITLNKSTILQGGEKCINPTITVTGTEDSCLLVNCIEDSSGNFKITVQIPDDCEDQCITYIIDCEDCNECPPQLITRCLCDVGGDCPNCFDCVEGFCQPIPCPTGQFCDPDTGDCVECVADIDCPCDQTCIDGTCQCPPDTYENSKGCCVECLTAEHCEGCDICSNGVCVGKSCPDGMLNEVNCDCVECIVNGDCIGDDECCIGGRCRCCPGFYRNSLGVCTEIPDCTTKEDCPECFTCVAGACEPIVCPDGRICVDEECVRACDCLNPNCPAGHVCIPDYKGDCYCSPCVGTCTTNNDCGEGCQCTGGQCVPKPCIGPCIDASDCGVGCGCLNGQCVDCTTLTCAQCATVLGCDCIGGNCVDSPCDSPCADGDDCANGCGCQANNCVACESVTCVTNANCPDGCFCDDGVCAENPCQEVYCSSPNDCGQGCGCLDGKCVPCSSIDCPSQVCDAIPGCACINNTCQDDGEDDCFDELTLTKDNANCNLRAQLVTDSCCQCDDIDNRFAVEYEYDTSTNALYNVTLELFKNNALLGDPPNIADDLPTGGVYQFRLEQTFREVYPVGHTLEGQFIPGGATTTTTITKNQSVAGIDTVNLAFTNADGVIPRAAHIVVIGTKSYRIGSRRLFARTTSNIQIVNECRYSLPEKLIYVRNSYNPEPADDSVVNFNTTTNRLVQCRLPIFTLFKSDTSGGLSNPDNILERYYAPRINNTTYRKLYTSYEDLEYGKFYRLVTDCGCDTVVDYSCFGKGAPATPLVFCHPTPPLNYQFNDCGKEIEILTDVVVNCNVYTAVGAAKPVYDLYLNGQIVVTRTLGTAPSSGNVLFNAAETFDIADCIESVELKQRLDVCEECTISQNHDCNSVKVSDVQVQASCSTPNTWNITFNVTGGTAPYTWTAYVNGVEIDDGVPTAGFNSIQITSPSASGSLRILVEDDAECTDEEIVFFSQTAFPVVIDGLCQNGQPVVRVANNSNSSASVQITGLNTNINTTIGANTTQSYVVPTSGISYSVTVTSNADSSCAVFNLVTPDCCNPNPLGNISFAYSCQTGLSIVAPSGTPVGTTYTYTASPGGALNGTSPAQGQMLDNGSYSVFIQGGGCSTTKSFTVECAEIEPCDTCDQQALFTNSRILSFTIDGNIVNFTNNTNAVFCSGGQPTVVGFTVSEFQDILANFLYGVNNCSYPQVSITCPDEAPPSDPNDCFDGVATSTIAAIVVQNTAVDIDGMTTGSPACFTPSVQECDIFV